jgi:PIN domain nuclease of toxin-antitoxin system
MDLGVSPAQTLEDLGQLDLDITPLDHLLAARVGTLRQGTRESGLSLGDRACLALAEQLGVPAVTADRAWASLDLGVEVVLIR